ncbi:ATP synthase subunit I [Pseudodesulfovibrio senegalensis]|uniref:ATP synthase subunit I n=1 Tax=Pseudodesulfovibrio senegalensis TaxID=1721087 RepID=A0A6N6N290_9BACT|nr:ATP synthase subunit I [Pseudodesulfovibrio senegalensis]KAB1441840.1 hypothetical protein F8A88_09650 [Pseudodesulfovibrio senegalensis]
MTIRQKIDRFLYARGFVHDEVRNLMRSQLCFSLGLAIGLLGVTLGSAWSLAFAAGAVVITLNFWALARIVQQLIYVQKGAVFTLLVIFYGKLILSGVVLYLVLGVWRLPVWGLVAGLSTVVVNITAWGLKNFGQNKPDA